MSGFFYKNVIFLRENSLKQLKRVQQELIDQARWNLAQPIMFKFSGVLSKYSKAFDTNLLFDQMFSKNIVSGINHSLILDKIEPIQYDFVETYWQKKYGDKRKAKPNYRAHEDSNSFQSIIYV